MDFPAFPAGLSGATRAQLVGHLSFFLRWEELVQHIEPIVQYLSK